MAFHAEAYGQNQSVAPQDDRNILNAFLRQGIRSLADLAVSAGSGFNSNIAAGVAGVPNTYQTQGGLYVIRNDAVVSVLHPTPDATYPRIDTVITKVYDSVDGGDASDQIPQPIVIAGTPTAGATLANQNGMATFPLVGINNYIRLAKVLVPNGAASAASFAYEDRRPKTAGFTNIATTQTRDSAVSGTNYGTLATPDQINEIVLPPNGVIEVLFFGTWQQSVANAARAGIFLGSNQTQIAYVGFTASGTAARANVSNTDAPVCSFPGGLLSSNAGSAYPGDATTGQIIGLMGDGTILPQFESGGQMPTEAQAPYPGGACYIFAAAGTYDVSVQFKSSSGTVTAKNRKLWVRVRDYNNCMV